MKNAILPSIRHIALLLVALLLVMPLAAQRSDTTHHAPVKKRRVVSERAQHRKVANLRAPLLRTGADAMEVYLPILQGKRIGVVANQSSLVLRAGYEHPAITDTTPADVHRRYTHLIDTLLSSGMKVKKIFCPEHGFRGLEDAGKRVNNSIDEATSLPIISLYGSNKKPQHTQLNGLDMVVFDLQDVGCRFYTYISTLHYVMEACAECNIPLLVLDRPNPNGHLVDGPILDSAFRSFVGMHCVPVVYGMTIGEYAQMINGQYWLGDSLRCLLQVVPLQGYTHSTPVRLPVNPSPNLRNPHAIALYPSLCFFEGTHVSVGRGTAFPFEQLSIDTLFINLRHEMVCQSQLDLSYLLRLYDFCKENDKAFFLKGNYFDLLAGTDELRNQLLRGTNEMGIRASWEEGLEEFRAMRSQYLLYPE